ncbi:hypothetical protein [Deinococcus sonorensis]|uniref:Uncharacterized protein n=2 Tax=Deinococcus sonorensis TaxID=309891 RepID=A0AAU7UB01_9DEIO
MKTLTADFTTPLQLGAGPGGGHGCGGKIISNLSGVVHVAAPSALVARTLVAPTPWRCM